MAEEHSAVGENAPKPWNQEVADAAIGKTVLVGVTYLSPDGETVARQVQYHGVIIRADRAFGVEIQCDGEKRGEVKKLPPDMTTFTSAKAGEYHLRSTGEVVVDPDFISSWTVTTKPEE
jgi:hypothetical protein